MNSQPAKRFRIMVSKPPHLSTPPNSPDIAKLLDILDGFLRHTDGIADHLADYLHTTRRDRAQPPDWAGYDANLLIDQVGFTAHSLRAHRRKPLQ
jgi:hypothetical protein